MQIPTNRKINSFKKQFLPAGSPYNVAALIISVLTISIFFTACGSGELSRSEAQTQIEKTNEFKSLFTLNLITSNEAGQELNGGGSTVEMKSADETPQEAIKRHLDTTFYWSPDVAVANHLGFLNVEKKALGKFDRSPFSTFGSYKVLIKIRSNEKGKNLWNNIRIPDGSKIDKDTELPLAQREFVEVTGVIKQGETGAVVDFTYKWNPFELGKYVDPNEAEFKKLPEEIRNNLQAKRGLGGVSKTADWSGIRKGQALFQKYDDGWRLQAVKL